MDEHKSKPFWHLSFSHNYFTITITGNPSITITGNPSSKDLKLWSMLLRKAETEPKVWLNNQSFFQESFNRTCMPSFCDMLKSNKAITALKIWRVLDDFGMESVLKVLQTNNTITEMDFYRNAYSDSGSLGVAFEYLIRYNQCLKTLTVEVGNEGVKGIGRALPYISTLTHLDLDNRHANTIIDNKGTRKLCQGLLHNRSITKINLNGNAISDDGAKDLCSVLEVNHTITDLDLRNNAIVLLPEAFAFLTHIKVLLLYGNSKLRSPPHIESLTEYFAQCRYGPMRFHFLLGFHERVGHHSSIQSLCASSIFEPMLLPCIFELLP